MNTKPDEDAKALIQKAYIFAEKAHETQKRASGEPYVVHVFETTKNLARYEMDATTISAGLLHDVLEDTEVTRDEMQKEFGEDIVHLVESVTKLGKIKYKGDERRVESMRKFFVAVADDFRVLMIKLSDRLHNLKTLEHVRPEKQKRIALESIDVYAALANRLGIGKLKGELEDAAFPFAYPKEYNTVETLLKERTENNQKYLESVKDALLGELGKQQIPVVKIDYRIKHKYSLWKKLQKYEMDIEKIYDILAIRIIVENIELCYRVLGLVHSIWKPLPGRIKDYIALPKLNGYQSIHTTIFTGDGGIVEIQIRTPEMHGQAEYGIASHFSYKKRTESTQENKKFQWINDFKKLNDKEAEQINFFDTLKKDLLTDRIFIFTPLGDIIDLPEDSSPIDFAYAVHSEIGNKTASAKVNGKMAPLSTKLHSGDIVEIVTNKNANPASKWLDYAKTGLAKRHINSYIKENSLLSRFLSFGNKN